MGEEINPGFVNDCGAIHDVTNKGEERRGDEAEVRLQRNLGLFSGVSLIVGTIVGSGIWVTPGFILLYSESVGIYLLQWAICGFISTLGDMCYLELACVVPLSGGETVYLKAGLGDFMSFMFSWLRGVVLGPTSCAFLAIVTSKYVLKIHPSILEQTSESGGEEITCQVGPDRVEWSEKFLAATLLLMSSGVNIWSAKWAAQVQNVFTVAKLCGIAIVVVGGAVRIAQGHTQSFHTGFDRLKFLEPIGPASIGLIAFNGLWNYDGWNQLNFVAEEIKDLVKKLPRAIFIGMPLVVILYVLINISYLTVLTPKELYNSKSVAVDWANTMLGPMAWTLPLSVAFSAFGSLNGSLFTAGRQVYAASKEGHLPQVISYINMDRKTPVPALLFNAVLAIIFIMMRDIDQLLNMYMVAACFFYGLSMLALLVMRWTKPDVPRPFKVWIGVPVFILLFFWYCMVAPLSETPLTTANIDMYKWNAICLAPGVVFYLLNVFWQKNTERPVPFVGSLTTTLQKMLAVVPSFHQD